MRVATDAIDASVHSPPVDDHVDGDVVSWRAYSWPWSLSSAESVASVDRVPIWVLYPLDWHSRDVVHLQGWAR